MILQSLLRTSTRAFNTPKTHLNHGSWEGVPEEQNEPLRRLDGSGPEILAQLRDDTVWARDVPEYLLDEAYEDHRVQSLKQQFPYTRRSEKALRDHTEMYAMIYIKELLSAGKARPSISGQSPVWSRSQHCLPAGRSALIAIGYKVVAV